MKTIKHKYLVWGMALLAVTLMACSRDDGNDPLANSIKAERNYLRSGNDNFDKERYAEAEVDYRKALQANPASDVARFNLATALLVQGGDSTGKDDPNNPVNQAVQLLDTLSQYAGSALVKSLACYDLGNLSYIAQQYPQAIECYKNALRINPDFDAARDNLRLAQLKKQQQDQNKNQNQDQDQDKNKQNQDKQNQDKQNQDKQDQDKQNQDKQNSQPRQGDISKQNAEQVLRSMQEKERATQQRINAEQAQQQRHERARTNNKW